MPAIASKLIEELFRISERFRDGRFGVQQEVGGRAVRVARDSGCGEVMCMGAERPKFVWTEGRRCIPVVIAGEVDVLPAEWRQMG
jgi:hypothetical protein